MCGLSPGLTLGEFPVRRMIPVSFVTLIRGLLEGPPAGCQGTQPAIRSWDFQPLSPECGGRADELEIGFNPSTDSDLISRAYVRKPSQNPKGWGSWRFRVGEPMEIWGRWSFLCAELGNPRCDLQWWCRSTETWPHRSNRDVDSGRFTVPREEVSLGRPGGPNVPSEGPIVEPSRLSVQK